MILVAGIFSGFPGCAMVRRPRARGLKAASAMLKLLSDNAG
jgi:hypothetical protein